MRRLLIVASFISASAGARTKIDVSPFANKTAPSACNAVGPWKNEIHEIFKHQLVNALNQSGHFTVVESELMRGEQRAKLYDSGVSTIHKSPTFKAAQYSVVGTLAAFDACDKGAEVQLEVRVIENADGREIYRFQSGSRVPQQASGQDYIGAPFNTGVFKDSPLGRATSSAIRDITAKLRQAFPDREIASGDYKIRTFRRPRR